MLAPERITDCKSEAHRLAWMARALRAGRTLSDAELWLAGVDRPQDLIDRLRAQGMSIVETTKRVVDAADEAHMDKAWRLALAPALLSPSP